MGHVLGQAVFIYLFIFLRSGLNSKQKPILIHVQDIVSVIAGGVLAEKNSTISNGRDNEISLLNTNPV